MSATITTLINPNDKVVINVSGMRFETWYMTLNRFPNTLLGDPRKRCKYFDYIHNEYFFERHRQSFESILYFYQSNGRFLNRPQSVSSEVFFDEIVFFELGEEAISKYKKNEGYIIDQEATLKDMPQNKVLRFFWMIFENPQSSLIARIIAVTSVICIIVSITVFCIETLPEIKQKRQNYLLNLLGNSTSTDLVAIAPEKDEIFYIETICIIWFSFEFIIRFICAPNKFQFIKHIGNIIDFFSILPYFMQVSETSVKFSILRIIRLVRVFRIFKLARHFKGLQILAHTLIASANELMLLVFFLVIGVVLFSSMVYFVELDHPNSDFDSIIHGFWYVIITMTTVGYGEVVPKTNLGRIVGSFCAIAGVLTIALPVPIIVSHFQFFYESNKVLKKINKETLRKSCLSDEEIQQAWFDLNSNTNLNHDSKSNHEISNHHQRQQSHKSILNCFKSNHIIPAKL